MNFRHKSAQDREPEINLVPLIDVMLVIIIFLMLTTTFNKTAGLEVALPTSGSNTTDVPMLEEIVVAVTRTGDIVVGGRQVSGNNIDAIAAALSSLRSGKGKGPDPVISINADAQAAHQNVINVMQASQQAGFARVTFATRQERR